MFLLSGGAASVGRVHTLVVRLLQPLDLQVVGDLVLRGAPPLHSLRHLWPMPLGRVSLHIRPIQLRIRIGVRHVLALPLVVRREGRAGPLMLAWLLPQ